MNEQITISIERSAFESHRLPEVFPRTVLAAYQTKEPQRRRVDRFGVYSESARETRGMDQQTEGVPDSHHRHRAL